MTKHPDDKRQKGKYLRALWPAGFALVTVCANSQDFPEPGPPVISQGRWTQPLSSLRAFAAQETPAAEWTYHKSVDGKDPEPVEQKMLWYMNRARTDPAAEGVWLAGITEPNIAFARSYFKVDLDVLKADFAALPPKPPAAFDIRLHEASEAHSLDLIARDAQDHSAQFDRIEASGFPWSGCRVSVYSYTRSALYGHAGLNIDWGLFDSYGSRIAPGMQQPPGHRHAIMGVPYGGELTSVGLALVAEEDPDTRVGPLVFSGAYCGGGGGEYNRFIVGTVWDDLDFDGEYDEGEGLAGVMVVPDSGTFFAVTGAAGGYAVPITSAGSYTVSFYGGDLGASQVDLPVDVGTESVLLDLKYEATDSDGDGVPDLYDAFPYDPAETTDSDGDGVGDNADAFPDDPGETTDSDGDGVGDNADAFPFDPAEWLDSDGDGIGDNAEEYPTGRYTDVPPAHPAYHHVEALGDAGITVGCDVGLYCPQAIVTRAQLAILLERALHGGSAGTAPASGAIFLDVGAGDPAAPYIEHLFSDGLTQGCDADNFCPDAAVTRAGVAVLLLRLKHGAGYIPPAAVGLFDDVPTGLPQADWIEQLAGEGISQGCDADNFCPFQALTRDQLGVLLAGTLGLL